MSPKFIDAQTWEQAELLMQPVMIRLVDNLRKQLEQSSWHSRYEQVDLPIPGYHLHLTYQEQQRVLSIWELCYLICFKYYQMDSPEPQPVEIDPGLLDGAGEIDWHYLDQKAQDIVAQVLTVAP